MVAGRTSVTPRALERVARGVAADSLGVDAARVSIRLSDTGGALAVAVTAPLRSAPLGTGAPGLVTRAEHARGEIADSMTRISGSRVGSVALHVTGIDIVESRRVS